MAEVKILFEEKYKIVVCSFFVGFLLLGISIFADYGVSWDERWQRDYGITTLKYVLGGNQELFESENKYHGPAFQVLLIGIEKILNLTGDLRAVYFMRHLVTFLLFYISVFCFYLLCKGRFGSWKMGLLGSLFLILSPRIFAHSFYNPKDIPFLAMFTMSIYTLVKYLDKKTWLSAAFHALACGVLIDIRILGIIVPCLTVAFLTADVVADKTRKISAKRVAVSFLTYTVLLVVFIVLFWPTLWPNPVYHFINAFKEMSRYTWKNNVLYLGDYIMSTELPWHYTPVWMVISTPILYIACFFVGCFVSVKRLLKNPMRFYAERRADVIFIVWFFLPLVATIAFGSTLYDSWRHMFFIYPAFLGLSLVGLTSVFEAVRTNYKGLRRKVVGAGIFLIVAGGLVSAGWFMAKYHPYQNVYFNRLAGRNIQEIKKNFELDYWGLSYREALEYILKNDKDEAIKIKVSNDAGKHSADILRAEDRERLVYVKKPGQAKYFLSNYRWYKGEYPIKDEYYSIKIGGTNIMVVYKLE